MSQHSARGAAWEAQRQRVLERDGWQCLACGVHLVGKDATVDHIEPISLNPSTTYLDTDLVSYCRSCNARKSDRVAQRLDYRNRRWFS